MQYWATAAAFELFGQSNFTARLWTALLGFLTVPWAFFVGARLFDRRAGLYAACMLGGSLIRVALGHLDTLDMGVSAFLTFGIGALVCSSVLEGSNFQCRHAPDPEGCGGTSTRGIPLCRRRTSTYVT